MSGVNIIIRNPPGGDLVELGNQFLYRGGWEVIQKAEEGAVGSSTLLLDDPDMSLWDYLGLNVGGRQQIRLVDIDSDKIVHFGFTGKRAIRRKYDDKGHPTGRAWSVDIWDPNTILQRRILTHNGARRPRESDVDRINALFDFPEWGIIDQFLIGPSETTMSKHDYRGMTVGQYIADCAQMSRKNYWVDIVDTGDGDKQTFWYGRDTRSAYESTISISNDLADLDLAALRAGTATTFPPSKDTEYSMDPSRVVDGIWASGEKTSVYRRRPETAEVFGLRWDLANQWPTVHEKDRLIAKAESMLERLKDEQEIIETAINVPASQAHLVRAGMLLPVKLTHVPAVSDFTDCRILARGLSPRGDGRRYRIPLTLEPVGPAEAALSCSTSVSAAVTVEVSDQAYAAHTTTVSITPEEGVDSVLFGSALSLNTNTPTDTAMAPTGSGVDLYSDDYTTGHPTTTHQYRAVAAASGSYDLTTNYTPGFGGNSHWCSVAVAVQTTATSPVQSKTFIGTGSTATLDAAPTVGNLLVLQISARSQSSFDTGTNLTPPSGFWTSMAQANATYGIGEDATGIFFHCVAEGDDEGPYGSPAQGVGVVSEWEIT